MYRTRPSRSSLESEDRWERGPPNSSLLSGELLAGQRPVRTAALLAIVSRASCKTPISAQIRPFAATPGPGANCLCPVGYANLRRARAGAKIIGFVQESGFCNWLSI